MVVYVLLWGRIYKILDVFSFTGILINVYITRLCQKLNSNKNSPRKASFQVTQTAFSCAQLHVTYRNIDYLKSKVFNTEVFLELVNTLLN